METTNLVSFSQQTTPKLQANHSDYNQYSNDYNRCYFQSPIMFCTLIINSSL
ncbi:hypothetical protein LAP8965_02521 [Lactiplantibacillus plantarum]|nr:hypothetical protein LAP8963_02533 [Lactiplantibacillus plantarum]SPE13060.1 hypothetical protein LAP8964_02435 [Lactiplantibacillus plantarum]SPH07185.1 hypothetical protein LAP8965_02521 [Lactiplantibacillus plantarum]SPH10336.1 hypothetical protein LAP8966_02531 [Lactiplantibacillus plantarum]